MLSRLMRILYGVNGEGMGHATRSEVVIGSLLGSNDVRVVASGAAYRHLRGRLPRVDEIFGPTFAMEEGEIRRWATVRQNVQHAFGELPDTVKRWVREVDQWKPDAVISDFEPLAGVYARSTRTPLIAVDNINMLDRCRHDAEIIGAQRQDYLLARAVAHSMVPGAVEYIITTFFEPPLARGGTTLVPPIIRPEIVAARSERGEHLVVYSSGDPKLLDALHAVGVPARVYGMRGGPEEVVVDGCVELRPRSSEDFVESLRTARGVIAGGGFSLLSEAIYLGKPILAVPLHGQFEQRMNARYVQRLGYGLCADEVDPEVLREFVQRLPEFEAALEGYEQDGNARTLAAISERATEAAAAGARELRRARWAARRVAR
ncbi:MAG TPA: glycosyltransferase family protein [Solirubrobacterales bacterium]|nr:glycosyltransferase family protein [Solirubrobacterales bacterium]